MTPLVATQTIKIRLIDAWIQALLTLNYNSISILPQFWAKETVD
jgi:hypothetical protein